MITIEQLKEMARTNTIQGAAGQPIQGTSVQVGAAGIVVQYDSKLDSYMWTVNGALRDEQFVERLLSNPNRTAPTGWEPGGRPTR